jgi:small subunit ribosomal protein S2
MKPYIFTERNGIHIIDLQQTLESLENAYALVRDGLAKGGSILFVGTKRQGQESIQLEAERCGMPYVNSRWLGGTLTNWRTIRSRITELENLERRRDDGEFELLTKKEALTMTRKINKLEERLGGIRNMKGIPSLLFVVDVRREETAIHEANLLEIPVIALVDTNCDPSGVDYIIPSNDDAIRAIKLLTSKIADAALEGIAMRKEAEDGEEVPESAAIPVQDVEMSDEDLLGEATLAKLQTGDYDERAARAEAAKAEAEAEVVVEEVEAEAEVEEVEAEAEVVVEEVEAEAEAEVVVEEVEAEAEVEEVETEAEVVVEEVEAEAEAEVEEVEAETEAETEVEEVEAEAEAEADESDADADDKPSDDASPNGEDEEDEPEVDESDADADDKPSDDASPNGEDASPDGEDEDASSTEEDEASPNGEVEG